MRVLVVEDEPKMAALVAGRNKVSIRLKTEGFFSRIFLDDFPTERVR